MDTTSSVPPSLGLAKSWAYKAVMKNKEVKRKDKEALLKTLGLLKASNLTMLYERVQKS